MNAFLELSTRHRSLTRLCLTIACALVLAATAYRSIQRYDAPEVAAFDTTRQGQFDFHNGIYFPQLGFLQGYNPYGKLFADQFPVTRQIPPYSPFTLLLHWPLGWMSVQVAEVCYFVITVFLLLLMACMTAWGIREAKDKWTLTLVVLFLLLASRAGHTTLFTGYFTVELVLGTLVALRYARQRPAISALGLLLTSIKPNFVLPLGILMLARGNVRALVYGATLSILGAAIPTAMLLSHTSVEQFLHDVQSSDTVHNEDDYELPVNTWTRVDGLAVVAKWLEINPTAPTALVVMLLILAGPAWILHLRRQGGDETGDLSASGILILLACSFSIYHHVYDTLWLIPAAVAVIYRSPQLPFSNLSRWLLAGAILFVPWNYLSSEQVLNRLQCTEFTRQCITSLSGLLLMLCLACWLRACVMARSPATDGGTTG